MKTLGFVLLISTLILQSCGDDAGSGNRQDAAPPTPERPAVETETPSGVINSQSHRTVGKSLFTYLQEIENSFKDTTPPTVHPIPDLLTDDEGKEKLSVFSRTHLIRPSVACGIGIAFTGIAERIKDCATKNGAKAVWIGADNGSMGEATWSLVSRDDTNKEIWLDNKTGMVWSDVLATDSNWCKASGNTQQPDAPSITDCNALAAGVSLCAGNETMEGIGNNIIWRLPTRNDYLQADLDGIRFVVKINALPLWTATINSLSKTRSQAWTYSTAQGILAPADLTEARAVRCIGAPRP